MPPLSAPTCPRCARGMEQGFTVDIGHGTYAVPKFVAGEPQKSIWTGLKLRGREQMPITTFRCRSCGYLENYA